MPLASTMTSPGSMPAIGRRAAGLDLGDLGRRVDVVEDQLGDGAQSSGRDPEGVELGRGGAAAAGIRAAELDLDARVLAGAGVANGQGQARPALVHDGAQRFRAGDRHAVGGDDHVAGLDPGFLGGAVGLNADDLHSGALADRDRLGRNAQRSARPVSAARARCIPGSRPAFPACRPQGGSPPGCSRAARGAQLDRHAGRLAVVDVQHDQVDAAPLLRELLRAARFR